MKAVAVFPGSREIKVIDQDAPRLTTLIAGRFPPEQAPDLILGRPPGIKTVIAFGTAGG
jgi:hypothetical protein